MDRLIRVLLITGGTTLLACCLGICQDIVTAHVQITYFTVYHPFIIETDSAVVMALIWGVITSWWFGLPAGFLLAIINERTPPQMSAKEVLTLVAKSCAAIWATIMVILVIAYLVGPWFQDRLPVIDEMTPEAKRRLFAVWTAHSGQYVFGILAVIHRIVQMRRRPSKLKLQQENERYQPGRTLAK